MKKKILPIIIIIALILLAGISVFLGNKLLTTRNESVSPAAPESKPAALTSGDDYLTYTCNKSDPTKTFKIGIRATGESPDCSSTTQGQCPAVTNPISTYNTSFEVKVLETSASFSSYHLELHEASFWCTEKCGQANSSGAPSMLCVSNVSNHAPQGGRTLNSTNNYTETFTHSRTSDVGSACGSYQIDIGIKSIDNCPDLDVNEGGARWRWGLCFTNIDCPAPQKCAPVEWSLTAATATPTPTATATSTPTSTPTATATPKSCNLSCDANADCQNNLICSGSMCRNPECLGETDCVCPPAATATPRLVYNPTPTPVGPSLPNAGVGTPTVLSIGGGFLLVITALLLAI